MYTSFLPVQADKQNFHIGSWSICPFLYTSKYSDLCPILSLVHFACIGITEHLFIPFLEYNFTNNAVSILQDPLYIEGNVHV